MATTIKYHCTAPLVTQRKYFFDHLQLYISGRYLETISCDHLFKCFACGGLLSKRRPLHYIQYIFIVSCFNKCILKDKNNNKAAKKTACLVEYLVELSNLVLRHM
jgi:hypothetical protein